MVKRDVINAERNAMIAVDRASGMSYRELAKRYDVSNASVSNILNKAEVKAILDEALNHLVSFAPLVVRNYRMLLESKSESIRLKATEALARILGVSPTHVPSNVTVMFNTEHNTTIVSDKMRGIIDKISGNQDFIDAEFEAIIDG